MQRTAGFTFSGLVALLFILLLATPVSAAWDEAYCSSQNTGSTDVYTQQFMSNGNCTDHCRDLNSPYAFAVIQLHDCYCSNYAPASSVDISQCGKTCPGFGSEHCGDVDSGLYIYIQNGQPSGTAPGSSSAKPTPKPSSKAPAPATSQAPAPPTTSQISLVVNTENGAAVTRTIYLTPSSDPSATSIPLTRNDSDNGTNIGAIVGGAIGGVAGLALIGLLVWFLLRRRKQRREAQDGDIGSSGGITRNTSTMSKAGLLGTTREINHNQYPPHLATNNSTQNSRYGDHESISPISNRRNSQPLVIDSRLNPNAVMTFAGASLSRESVVSLDDSRDYGRQLNVRNPDP